MSEKVLFEQTSDLDRNRRFRSSTLVVTDKRLVVSDDAGEVLALPLPATKKVRVDELFGSARLVAETADGDRHLIYYSKAYVPHFAALSRAINDLVAGRAPVPPELSEPAYCAKCGAPLPERGSNCSLCVQRFQVFKRLLGLLRPYRTKTLCLVAATFATVAAQMGPPYITKRIVDDVIRGHHFDRLPWWIGAMLGCGVLLLLARLTSGTLTSWLGAHVVADLWSQLHAALQRLQMSYFQRRWFSCRCRSCSAAAGGSGGG